MFHCHILAFVRELGEPVPPGTYKSSWRNVVGRATGDFENLGTIELAGVPRVRDHLEIYVEAVLEDFIVERVVWAGDAPNMPRLYCQYNGKAT